MSEDNNKNSDSVGGDFNDMAVRCGLPAVTDQLSSLLDVEGNSDVFKQDAPPKKTSAAKPSEGYKPVNKVSESADKRDLEAETVGSAESGGHWWNLFERTKDGLVKASVRNTALVFEHDDRWNGVLGYNDFSYKIEKRIQAPLNHAELGMWEESDAASLRVWMAEKHGFTPNHQDISDALMHVAKANRFHPVREWLDGLEWDGEGRLDGWLHHAFEAGEDARYLSAIGSRYLVGAVARVFQPGCKFDNVLILEGKQGIGKSTVISALFGEWFTDSPLPIGDKEQYGLMYGKWGYELAELSSFSKKEEETLKGFFSQRVDRFRPPYGRTVQDHQRQTVFIGTTNDSLYMKDVTGNRRYWPVGCTCAHVSWVYQNREQLWAEAYHRYKEGQHWHIAQHSSDADESLLADLVADVQDLRAIGDSWADKLHAYLVSRELRELTMSEILEEGLGIDAGHHTPPTQKRVAGLLIQLGWIRRRTAKARLWKLKPVQIDLLDGGPVL